MCQPRLALLSCLSGLRAQIGPAHRDAFAIAGDDQNPAAGTSLPKRWCALVDGNRFQLDLLRLAAADYGVELTIVLDLIHVCEYLWQAAWALHQAGDRQAEAWVSKRLLAILRGQSAQVAAGIRRSATLRGLSEKARAPLDKCADYLLKYRDYLRYDQYLAAG